jgi:DeoR family transcriptional regulator, suf operon transcriptional repressor
MPGATITGAGLRIMKLLVGNPPQTVSGLIRATGVTRTAVTEQLNELVAAGYVERTVERLPGRGRPRHLFTATNASLLGLFPGNQNLVVPATWQAIAEVGGQELVHKVLKRVSRKLADHYSQRITAKDPKQRLQRLIELLRDEGVLADSTDRGGHAGIRKRSCPFLSMADENHTVCTVDLEMMSTVVGQRITQTACRHNGDACCSFEIEGNG